MEPIVGIDLGTTNSEVAYIINENAEVLTEGDNGIFPSCVGIDAEGGIIVGAEARNQAVLAPDRTVMSVKRLMGTDTEIPMGEDRYRPQEISAFILKALKARAEKVLGRAVSKAVITVPAYFTDAQRHATREAGRLADLEVIRIINEPTAAALAYESTRSESRRILIYDLGGGTFDVSIVKIEQGVVEVLASTGDNHLGGDDFDQKIADRLMEYCTGELKLNDRDNPVLKARLKRAAETAKIDLSSAPYARVEEDHIGKRKFKDVHLSYELSRQDFEEMIEDDLARTMESVNKALKDSESLPSAIDKIILVGGSTRIPRISAMLEEKFDPNSENFRHAGGKIPKDAPRRDRPGSLRGIGSGHSGRQGNGPGQLRYFAGHHPLYLRDLGPGGGERHPHPPSVCADDPQKHQTPGRQNRSLLHGL